VLQGSDNNFTIGTDSGGNTNILTLDTSGNVGIGDSSPLGKLHVNGLTVLEGATSVDATSASTATSEASVRIKPHNDNGASLWASLSSNDSVLQAANFNGSSVYDILLNPFGGNVGIGINPSKKLTVFGTGSGNATVQIEGEGGADPYINFLANNTQHWSLGVDDSDGDKFKLSKHSALGTNDYLVVDTSGRVGIGTVSPNSNHKAHIEAGSGNNTSLLVTTTDNADTAQVIIGHDEGLQGGLQLISDKTNSIAKIRVTNSSQFPLSFQVRGSDGTHERMRIDSSGNVLVGTTDNSPVGNNVSGGVGLFPNGSAQLSRDGGIALLLNRKTSDGIIADFRKDGTTVGSIECATNTNTDISVGSDNVRLLFFTSGSAIVPRASSNTTSDNAIDLGNSSNRFKDIYATNGTIQTSDINEKQDIEELNDAELRVAQQAKTLLRKYRWKSSVEEKGDDARIHFGIIAQDLEQAFTDEGLDAGRYGMFIKSTWTNEDGEEQTRLGVRYNQLLAFIISTI
jgi:hypothetical protein